MERSDVWLLSGYTFRGVAVLFRPFLGPQSTPTLLHISAIVRNQNFIAVFIVVVTAAGFISENVNSDLTNKSLELKII